MTDKEKLNGQRPSHKKLPMSTSPPRQLYIPGIDPPWMNPKAQAGKKMTGFMRTYWIVFVSMVSLGYLVTEHGLTLGPYATSFLKGDYYPKPTPEELKGKGGWEES
eukprot:Rmarinus@m.19721